MMYDFSALNQPGWHQKQEANNGLYDGEVTARSCGESHLSVPDAHTPEASIPNRVGFFADQTIYVSISPGETDAVQGFIYLDGEQVSHSEEPVIVVEKVNS